MKKLYLLAILGLFALTAPIYAQAAEGPKPGTYALDPNHGKVTWSISHLGFSTYIGQFTGVAATLVFDPTDAAKSSLDVTVQTDSVGTLNPALDKHLKSADFFNVDKFPTATFKSTKITFTSATMAKVRGNFTLLGVTKPLTIYVTLNQAGDNPFFKYYEAGFTGAAHLKRSEWGLSKYTPALGDEVNLQIEGEFKFVQ